MATNASLVPDSFVGWRFDNTYARLPEILFAEAQPAKMPAPRVAILNQPLARQFGLDLDVLTPESAANLFAGQELPSGAQPIAQAYAGHQFGSFTMLGDGRAILMGEHRTPSAALVDVQFKGAGQTRFSRGGDGRAALGPMLREYVISEAMAALEIPSTRSLAVVTTGESVYRSSRLPGAILTRIASSHIRVGTFQYVAALRDVATLKVLADYAIERHYPELSAAAPDYLEFFRAVAERQASLIAQWQLVGFIHGVMNTDNMAISGETIDYGPCAFMNAYNPDTVFSSIDYGGRYAYANQPLIAQWNLARFAETLLPLIDADAEKAISQASEVLNTFPERFQHYWLAGMRRKLGLESIEQEDAELIDSLLDWMHRGRADFTNTFRDLSSEESLAGDQYQDASFRNWQARWQVRFGREHHSPAEGYEQMRTVNPAVIPRNHRVEEALAAAEHEGDLTILHQLLNVLSTPYEGGAQRAEYRQPPVDESNYRTFCGT